MKWIVRVNGRKILTTGVPDTASRNALREYAISDYKSHVQVLSVGPLKREVLVEEWGTASRPQAGGKE